MHCQCYFCKLKSSADTGAAATLRYTLYKTGSHGYHMSRTQRVYSTTILSVEIGNLRMHPNTSVGFS